MSVKNRKRYLKKKYPCSYCDKKYSINEFARTCPGMTFPDGTRFSKTYTCFDCAIAQEGDNPYNRFVGTDYCPECKRITVWVDNVFDDESCTACGFNYRGDNEEESWD